MTMRRLFHQTSHMARWRDCAIASVAFLAAAAALHFAGTTSKAAFGERAFDALAFSATTFGAGLAIGLVVWGVARIVAGAGTTIDMKDTVLWVASLFGVIWVGLAVLS